MFDRVAGTVSGTAGGACFKFVPSTPWDGTTTITTGADLSKSPLASGTILGLRVGKRGPLNPASDVVMR